MAFFTRREKIEARRKFRVASHNVKHFAKTISNPVGSAIERAARSNGRFNLLKKRPASRIKHAKIKPKTAHRNAIQPTVNAYPIRAQIDPARVIKYNPPPLKQRVKI